MLAHIGECVCLDCFWTKQTMDLVLLQFKMKRSAPGRTHNESERKTEKGKWF